MDKLRMGIIGVGGRGGLARHWQESGRAEVVAGCDVSDKQLAEFKEQFGSHVFVTKDYRQLLARDGVDAVAITSPDFTHEEYATAALGAGKHVFCEKPLAITTRGCDRILRAWRASGKKLMVGFNMRYMRDIRTMKDIVESGVIGEVKAAWCRHFVGAGGDFYYHDWHATRKNTTGLLLQKASHDIDVLHWICGGYATKVVAFGKLMYYGGDKPNDLTCDDCAEWDTCVEAQPKGHPRPLCAFRKEVDVEDHSMVLMELDNGIQAAYLQCHFTPDYQRNYTFIGTEGRMENLPHEDVVRVWMRDTNAWKSYANRTYTIKPHRGGHGGADAVICVDFLDMVQLDKEPIATALAGRMSVAAGVAASQSLRKGGVPVEIPPPPAWLR